MLSRFKYTALILLSILLVGCGGGGGTVDTTTTTVESTDSTTVTTAPTTTPATDPSPVALSKTISIAEDTTETITLESDSNNTEVTYTITTPPSYGILVGTPPNVIYVPQGDFNGTDTFSFTVTDPDGTSSPATIEIIVNDAPEPTSNIAPEAVSYDVILKEDSSASTPMAAVDANGDTLTFKVTNGPFNGTYDSDTHIYTPNKNFNGTDSFKYIANDGSLDSNEAKITITVSSVNDAPTATEINVTTDEDTSKTIILKGNDVDGDTLQYKITHTPQHGTYDLTTQKYTPNTNFNGTDNFTYVANDGIVDSAPATVTITVNAINDIPTADSFTLSTNEDTAITVALTGNDVDGDPLTFKVVISPNNGTFDGTTYTPNANFNGTDSFTYVANDGTEDSSEATVSITIIAINDAPIAKEEEITLNEDESTNITLSGTDIDGDPLTFRVTTPPNNGTFDGTTYTPNANFNGTDSFTYVANDGTIDSAPATINITVKAVNDTPVANSQDLTTDINTALDITLTGTDIDEDSLSYTIVQSPANGTLSGTAPNLTYTPDQDYTGTDSFTFTVNDGTTDSTEATVSINIVNSSVNLTGKITYDYVPGSASGLDYANIVQKPVRNAVIELIDDNGNVLQETRTDVDGNYTFENISSNSEVKVRISAKMLQTGTPAWDVKVVDNTNSDALYVMEGALASVGTSDQVRNLNAPSGWDGDEYSSERTAAPFAILDDIYATVQTILSADPEAVFPSLQVNWSVNNIATWGDTTQGEIGTSHYINGNLFILGDADSDTDEYDNHVITHEWGHYYEDKFSRSDSIGGSHSDGDILDIRVAFGEGWGNAFSAISLNDPIYFDTYGTSQASGWSMDMDNMAQNNPGWFSESSVQRIIYDLWDSNNEAENNDAVTLGFGPIHQVMTGAEKTTPAFTSIFTFITNLKNEQSAEADAIDDIVSNESITTIDDIFGGLDGGTERTHYSDDYPYSETSVDGSAAKVVTKTEYGTYNKLSNRVYVKFNIPSDGTYTITVKQTNDTDSDPDYSIYKLSPFSYINRSESSTAGEESNSFSLTAGDYLLDISEFNKVTEAQFDVTVTQ